MTDVAVYHFMRRSTDGKEVPSKRRATLESIQDKGVAIMQSARIVDHTEVDGSGFLMGGTGEGSHAVNELWPEIRSLELRAQSRDEEALKMVDDGAIDRKHRLQRESVELRNQARLLRDRIARMTLDQPRGQRSAEDLITYWHRRPR